MEQKYCSKKRKRYKHLDERERCKIEALLEGKKKAEETAIILRRDKRLEEHASALLSY